MTKTETIPSQPISASEMNGVQINKNGTKIKLSADTTGEGSPEMLFTKQ